jgi:hypothetical protein
MASLLSTYAGNAVLNAILNNTALALSPFGSLHSDAPGLTGANELPTAYGYGTRPPATFAAPDGDGDGSNSAVITFPICTGTNWSAASNFGLFDAATNGNFIAGATLGTAFTVNIGEYAEFAIGALTITGATDFGDAMLDAIYNALFRNISLAIAVPYVSYHTADPAGTGANELPNSNGYARVAMSYGAAASKACAVDAVADSGPVVTAPWSAASHAGLWSSGTYGAGTFIWGCALGTGRTVQVGKLLRVAINGISLTIT